MNTSQAVNRVCQVLRRQHKALSTGDPYVFWLRRYIAALHGIPSELSSEKKVEPFLTQLAQRDISASSQNQAFNAILFFYTQVLVAKAVSEHDRAAGLRVAYPGYWQKSIRGLHGLKAGLGGLRRRLRACRVSRSSMSCAP